MGIFSDETDETNNQDGLAAELKGEVEHHIVKEIIAGKDVDQADSQENTDQE